MGVLSDVDGVGVAVVGRVPWEVPQEEQQHQFTIFNYHVYRHGVYGVYIDIIILKVITIRHERITTRHKLGLKLDMSY